RHARSPTPAQTHAPPLVSASRVVTSWSGRSITAAARTVTSPPISTMPRRPPRSQSDGGGPTWTNPVESWTRRWTQFRVISFGFLLSVLLVSLVSLDDRREKTEISVGEFFQGRQDGQLDRARFYWPF